MTDATNTVDLNQIIEDHEARIAELEAQVEKAWELIKIQQAEIQESKVKS